MNGTLNAYLSSYVGLTALVGDRIYTGQAPQGTVKPYVVHFTISDIPDYTLTGRTKARQVSMQISCFASSLSSAEAVETQVVDALDSWPDANRQIRLAKIESRYDLTEQDTDLFHRAIDTTILYEEE